MAATYKKKCVKEIIVNIESSSDNKNAFIQNEGDIKAALFINDIRNGLFMNKSSSVVSEIKDNNLLKNISFVTSFRYNLETTTNELIAILKFNSTLSSQLLGVDDTTAILEVLNSSINATYTNEDVQLNTSITSIDGLTHKIVIRSNELFLEDTIDVSLSFVFLSNEGLSSNPFPDSYSFAFFRRDDGTYILAELTTNTIITSVPSSLNNQPNVNLSNIWNNFKYTVEIVSSDSMPGDISCTITITPPSIYTNMGYKMIGPGGRGGLIIPSSSGPFPDSNGGGGGSGGMLIDEERQSVSKEIKNVSFITSTDGVGMDSSKNMTQVKAMLTDDSTTTIVASGGGNGGNGLNPTVQTIDSSTSPTQILINEIGGNGGVIPSYSGPNPTPNIVFNGRGGGGGNGLTTGGTASDGGNDGSIVILDPFASPISVGGDAGSTFVLPPRPSQDIPLQGGPYATDSNGFDTVIGSGGYGWNPMIFPDTGTNSLIPYVRSFDTSACGVGTSDGFIIGIGGWRATFYRNF